MAFTVPQVSNAVETVSIDILCDRTQRVFDTLKNEHGESPVLLGKTFDKANSTMSLWTNPTSGTWTILATVKNVTCIIGTGDDLTDLPVKKFMNL
jgi:hypothetical protein